MGNIMLCVGDYAEVPYYVEAIGLNIYSMEELCYYITENAFLLDREIMSRDMVDWIDEQCGLKELGRTLYGFLNTSASMSVFVGTILEYVGYVSKQEIQKIQEYLRRNAGLTTVERGKAHADYLVVHQRYAQAQKEYHQLREYVVEAQEDFRAKVYHNEGVAFAGMMLYEEAAKCFLESYELNQSEATKEAYLSALRLLYNERDYLAWLAQHPEMTEAALHVESKFNSSETQFLASESCLRVQSIVAFRTDGKIDQYEKQLEQEIVQMKDEYRTRN